MTKKAQEMMNQIAIDDLDVAKSYIEDNDINSYLVIVNSNTAGEYYIAHNYLNTPAHLIANLELVMLEFKLRFALMPLIESLEQSQGVGLLDIKDMLSNIAKGSKLDD